MSKVIVVLDDEGAESLLALLENDVAFDREEEAVRAALDRDPDALIEQVARIIDDGVRGRTGSVTGPVDLAREVLAAITREGKA